MEPVNWFQMQRKLWSHQKPLVSRELRREAIEVKRRKIEEPRRLSRPRRPERREGGASLQKPTPKRMKKELSGYTDKELREEMRKRRFKVSGRTRERMIFLLEEDNKTQKVIAWGKEDTGRGEMGNQLRGVNGEMKEEERTVRAQATSGEDGEAEWEDV